MTRRAAIASRIRLAPILRNVAAARWLERRDARQLEAVQSRLLRRLVQHAYANVPYYRRTFDPGEVARLRSARHLVGLPILDRMDLHEATSLELLADGFTPENTKPATTSGSSGIPVTVRNSEADLGYLRAVYLNDLLASGLRPWDRFAVLRVNPFLRHPLERFGVVRNVHIDTSRSISEQADAFLRGRPTFLTGFPNAIYSLVEELERRGVRYRGVSTVLFGGERLAPAVRAHVLDYFDSRAHEVYASVEVFTIARSCPRGSLHLRTADVVAEVEHDDGTVSVENGEGEILVTRLRSEAMPLIRYRLGDRVCVAPNDCPCGVFHTPIVRAVLGRDEDRVWAADGRAFSGDSITFPVQRFPEVRRMQIVQHHAGAIAVRVVTAPGARHDLASDIRRAVERAVPGFAVTVDRVAAITPEPNGKVKLVKVLCAQPGGQSG